MNYTKSIKPISYLKAHASEMVNDAAVNGTPYIITQNGEAKAILLDLKEYQKTEEKMALLKILSMSEESIRKGKYKPIDKAFQDLRKKINKFKKECGVK